MVCRKIKLGFLVIGLLVGVIFPAHANEPEELATLIKEALEKSPEIRQAQARADASRARISQRGAWEDPRVGVSLMNLPIQNPSLDRTPMSGVQYGIQQKVPFPGKKRLGKKKARLESIATDFETKDLTSRVLWQIRSQYYNLLSTTQTKDVLKRNQKILGELVRLAKRRFASNLAPEQDVLKAQVEYGRMSDQLLRLNQKEKSLTARINSLAGRGSFDLIPLPIQWTPTTQKIDRDLLLKGFSVTQPLLQASQKRVSAAKADLTLARWDYLPDIDLGFAYRQRKFASGDPVSGEDFFTVSLTVPLPLFAPAKQHKRIKETAALFSERAASLEVLKNKIIFEVEDIISEMERAEQQRNLIKKALLPQSKAAFQNSKTAYRTGKVDFLDVLTNRLSVLQFEVSLIHSETDYAKVQAKLNYLLGGSHEE